MKSLRDEILLRRKIRTDLISSAKQISSERSEDFIAPCAISLIIDRVCGTVNFKEVILVAENKLADMSKEFAIQILKLTDGIKVHYSLSNQLERSGTPFEIDTKIKCCRSVCS